MKDYDDLSFQDLWEELSKKKTPKNLELFAEKLGVDPISLQMMECTWIEEEWAWGFPIVHEEKIVGIRLINEQGAKYYVKGSQDGSFRINGEIDSDIAKIIKLIKMI